MLGTDDGGCPSGAPVQLLAHDAPQRILERLGAPTDEVSQRGVDHRLVVAATRRVGPVSEPVENVVVENEPGIDEAHTVLSPIRPGLGLIPFILQAKYMYDCAYELCGSCFRGNVLTIP